MKSRVSFYVTFGLLLLLLGVSWFTFSKRNQQPAQIYTATVDRDCAPWDGAAFTVSIPVEGSVINLSIYRSPDLQLPVTFTFPDETMRDGNALLFWPAGLPAELNGKVTFQRVEQGSPVEGKFDLVTDTGQQFKGRFIAEWGNLIVYCG